MDSLIDDGFVFLGGLLENGRDVLHVISAQSEEAVRERLAADSWAQNACRKRRRPYRSRGDEHGDALVVRTRGSGGSASY